MASDNALALRCLVAASVGWGLFVLGGMVSDWLSPIGGLLLAYGGLTYVRSGVSDRLQGRIKPLRLRLPARIMIALLIVGVGGAAIFAMVRLASAPAPAERWEAFFVVEALFALFAWTYWDRSQSRS